MDFLGQYLVEIVLGLVSTGLLCFCKYLHSQLKYFKNLTKEKTQEEYAAKIQAEMQPVIDEIHRLEERIKKVENKETYEMGQIVMSYKFRLIQLCKAHISKGFMTQEEYDQLSEFYRVYSALGGNGQAAEYYERAEKLAIHN